MIYWGPLSQSELETSITTSDNQSYFYLILADRPRSDRELLEKRTFYMPDMVLSIVGLQNSPMNSQPARMWLINTIVVYITANPPTSILCGWYTINITIYFYIIQYTYIFIHSLLP